MASDGVAADGAEDDLIKGDPSYGDISREIAGVALGRRRPRYFWLAFGLFFVIALGFLFTVTWLLAIGGSIVVLLIYGLLTSRRAKN